jgi:hypothetical protein
MNRREWSTLIFSCLVSLVALATAIWHDLYYTPMMKRRMQQEKKPEGWEVTVKKDLVEDKTRYHFADPKFIGRGYIVVGDEIVLVTVNGKPVEPRIVENVT